MLAPNTQDWLDLDDRKQYLSQVINTTILGSDTDWYIFCRKNAVGEPFLWLGTRTHDLSGVEYSHKERVSLAEAEWLYGTEFKPEYWSKQRPCIVYLFMDAFKEYKNAKPTVANYIGA